MVVGVARVVLLISENASLKGKRKVVKSDHTAGAESIQCFHRRNRRPDLWQKIELGFSTVGNDSRFVNSCVDKIIDHIEEMNVAEMIDSEIEVIHV
jgi:uncharacterized protein YlxP (DUF503 family)